MCRPRVSVQRPRAVVDWFGMQLRHVPGLGVIGYLDRDLYLRDESERELPLAMQHRLALRRLGAVIEDQLGVSSDLALLGAARVLGGCAEA